MGFPGDCSFGIPASSFPRSGASNISRAIQTHAVQSLRDVDAKLLGAVFTMVPLRGGSSYGYSYKYYGKGPQPRPAERGSRDVPTEFNLQPSVLKDEQAESPTAAQAAGDGKREASQ